MNSMVWCSRCEREVGKWESHWGRWGYTACQPARPEPTEIRSTPSQNEVQEAIAFRNTVVRVDMAEQLGVLRFDRMLSERDVSASLELARHAVAVRTEEILEKVDAAQAPLLQHLSDPFEGLATKKLQLAVLRDRYPYVQPRIIYLDGNAKDPVGTLPIDKLIIRKLQHDAKYRRAVVDKSDRWKQGTDWNRPTNNGYADFDDGCAARTHPHLMREATHDESCDVRVALIAYFDEVEARPQTAAARAPARLRHPPRARPLCAQTCDALAYAKGRHKLGGYQFATFNLPVEERFDHDNILLAGLAKNLTIKKYGFLRVMCGRDNTGKSREAENIGADLKRCADGIWCATQLG